MTTYIFHSASRAVRFFAFALALLAMAGAAVPAHAQPQLTVQQEWHAHPNLVKAVHAMRAAMEDLEKAPHDFGGNKAKAMEDIKVSIHSLKKAILYRLKMDDAAIDAVNENQ